MPISRKGSGPHLEVEPRYHGNLEGRQATAGRGSEIGGVSATRVGTPTAERVELYRYVPPPGGNIPISMEPSPVGDLVPTEDKIEWAVKRLRNHRSRGPSGMRAEHLKRCLAEVRKAVKEDTAVGEDRTEETTGGGEG